MMMGQGTTARGPAPALHRLLAGIVEVPEDIAVSDVTLDSREVTPGSLFLACRGRDAGIGAFELHLAGGPLRPELILLGCRLQ